MFRISNYTGFSADELYLRYSIELDITYDPSKDNNVGAYVLSVHLQETYFFVMTFLDEWEQSNYTQVIGHGFHQQYMFLKVNPSQMYAYVFGDSFIITFDTLDFNMLASTSILVANSSNLFQTHAVDITETYGILVGGSVMTNMTHLSICAAILVAVNPLKMVISKPMDDKYLATAKIFSYNRANDMSVAINPRRHIAIIGLPAINKVVLLNINATSTFVEKWNFNITRTEVAPQHYTGFGQSVAWIDDTTVAIAILTVPNRPWSQSEVWVFDVDKPFKIPLFIFPNNQQKIIMPFPPLFLQTLSFSGNLAIVTNQNQFLLVPSQPAGFVSAFKNDTNRQVIIFDSAVCMAGTYKNTSGFGPCTVCPPQTKNPGNQPSSQCGSCTPASFCPLGSVSDLSLNTYPSYTQTFSYPNSPDMNNYDDLLVQNIFAIGHSHRCIVISPLFWTIIVITLCFIIWLFMTLPKMCDCPKAHFRRNRAKQFFQNIDIVNEGERWIGGLFSFAILLLFGFTFWFASEFLNLYPIETSGSSYISCDDTVRNAVFESALQLPLPNPDGSRWAIFDMLGAQPFTMTVDLLNTAADCSSITVQQNRPGVNYLRLSITSCVLQSDNMTRSVSFSLPSHRTSVQLNITGPFFVGGMRLCLYGPGHIDSVHALQTLDMCQLFSTVNETLSSMTTLHMIMIKVVNVTKPLKVGGDTHYDGRWAPTFVESSLSDELIYEQDGHYLRYISERTIVTITLSEHPFYLQNNQQPIVRRAELAFHTLLFCTLIIELFGMGFLLFRLVIMPFIRAVLRCYHREKRNDNVEEAPLPGPTTILPTNHLT